MNFKEIKELIEILDKSTLTEINIEDTKGKVTLKKEKRNWDYHATNFTNASWSCGNAYASSTINW